MVMIMNMIHSIVRVLALLLLLLLLLLLHPAHGYIPAGPSNQSSSSDIANQSSWIIQLNWLPIGVFSDAINHQLKSDSSNHSIYQGVLLHFSELNATTQPPTTVPWIAMINCDSNSSVFSNQDDIFTLARDRGAAAAMLYSHTSNSCLVNPDYSQNFEKPLDVFSAGSLQGARLIESQFSNVLNAGYWFESNLLNASASTILEQIKSLGLSNLTANPTSSMTISTSLPTQTSSSSTKPDARSLIYSDSTDDQSLIRRSSIDQRSSDNSDRHNTLVARASHPPDSSSSIHLNLNLNSSSHHSTSATSGNHPVYLIATLANAEITGNLDSQRQARSQNSNAQFNNSSNNPNTGLAMIILYAITGCVSFMFLIVIVSGAIRAIRNPDRYGPRPGGQVDPDTGEEDPFAQPRQTRAEGLGKAILDTFPIVKFGRQNDAANKNDPESVKNLSKKLKLDLDNNSLHPAPESIMMYQRGQVDQPSPAEPLPSDPADPNNLTTVGNKSSKGNDEQFDDEEPGSVASGIDPYQLAASQVPLLSQTHLSPITPLTQQATSSYNPNLNKSETENEQDISKAGSQGISEINKSSLNNQLSEAEVSKTSNLDVNPDKENGEGRDDQPLTADVNNSTTCAICVCEFVDDDDIRMLPCDARHQFHKECVDPWLLNESRFCPLCRWDLSTRKDGSKIVTEEVVLETVTEAVPSSPQFDQPHPDSGSSNNQGQQPERNQAARRDEHRPRTLPAWMSLRDRTSSPTAASGQRSPSGGSSNRPHIPFSIIPIRRRQRDQPATEDRRSSIVAESTHQRSHSDPQPQLDGHRTRTDTHHVDLGLGQSDPQESHDSANRFQRYLRNFRRR